MNRRDRLVAPAMLLGLGVLVAAATRPVSAQIPVPGVPSVCASAPVNVQAPASGAPAIEGGYEEFPTPLASLDDAQNAYDFQLLLPTDIPSGYQLGQIFDLHPSAGAAPAVLTICYISADGHYLAIEQGYPLPVDESGPVYELIPDEDKGTTTVQGREAYWTLGSLTSTASAAPQQAVSLAWQSSGSLRLGWDTDIEVPRPAGAFVIFPGSSEPMAPPPLYIGYQLESDSLDLDQLMAIGDSVQPYQSPGTGPSEAGGS